MQNVRIVKILLTGHVNVNVVKKKEVETNVQTRKRVAGSMPLERKIGMKILKARPIIKTVAGIEIKKSIQFMRQFLFL